MSAFSINRRIALFLVFLKQELRPPTRKKLPDKSLAEFLNAVRPASPLFVFDHSSINQLLNGRMRLNQAEEDFVLDSLQRLLDARVSCKGLDVRCEPPKWLEERYVSQLPESLRDGIPTLLEVGEKFGDKADLLNGFWRLFIVITLDDRFDAAPQIVRCPLLFVSPTETKFDLVMVTRQRRWRGKAHMMGNHLYLDLQDVDRTKNAHMIMNLPFKTRLMICGGGLTIEPYSERPSTAAVISFVCFAEKYEHPEPSHYALIENYLRGNGDVAEQDAEVIRESSLKIFDHFNSFAEEHPGLAAYVTKHHKINGKRGEILQSICVAYQ